MKGFERPSSESSPESKFEALTGLPLKTIEYREIPEDAKQYFESQSSRYFSTEEPREQYFQKLYSFNLPNGDVGYVAEQDVTYMDGDKERLTYFVDTRDGGETGYIELRFNSNNKDKYFVNKPFVGFTRTQEDFKKEGLAERRYKMANAYALAHYGHPLNSDTVIDDGAKRIWERLVERGEAEKFKEGEHDRFRFMK